MIAHLRILLQVMVPDNMVGLIIGRGGEQITRLQVFLISEPSFGFRDHITKTFINFRPRVAAKSRCPRIARECHTGLFSQPLPIL